MRNSSEPAAADVREQVQVDQPPLITEDRGVTSR